MLLLAKTLKVVWKKSKLLQNGIMKSTARNLNLFETVEKEFYLIFSSGIEDA